MDSQSLMIKIRKENKKNNHNFITKLYLIGNQQLQIFLKGRRSNATNTSKKDKKGLKKDELAKIIKFKENYYHFFGKLGVLDKLFS